MVKDLIAKDGMMLQYTALTKDSIELLAMLVSVNKEQLEKIIKGISDEPIHQIFYKRVKAFNLEDKIDPAASVFPFIFGIDNPGAIMLYLIQLLDYYDEHGKPATAYEISTNIYPYGWYDKNIVNQILDKFVKNKIAKNSYIY